MVKSGDKVTMQGRHRLTISLSQADYEGLVALATDSDRSLNWVITRALRGYLEAERPQRALRFDQQEGR